jgi:hypothetical protein
MLIERQAGQQVQNGSLHLVDLVAPVSKLDGVVAVIPAHNEERFIGSVVLATRQYVDRVLVIDDGSTDNTALVAGAAGAQVISLQTNCGKGAALRKGMNLALQEEGLRAIVLMDGDGQHHPRELPDVVRPVLQQQADLVVGSRFLEIKSEIPRWRQVGQHGLTWVTNSTSGVQLTDSQSGFRALSPAAAAWLSRQRSKGFSIESEMQFVIKERGLKVKEVPISCVYVEPPKRNPFVHGLQVLEGIFRLVGQSRPMVFFGLLALATLLSGVLMGNWVVSIYNSTQELAIGYALITVLLVILGTICLSTGFILHTIRSLLLHLWGNDEA